MGLRTLVVVGLGAGLVLAWSPARADAPPPIADAIKQAAAAHKPLVLEFGAQWCGPCKAFEKQVLPKSDVVSALTAVVFVRYDVDENVGAEAAAKYDVHSYPTFIVVDRQGVVIARESGFLSAKPFIALIEKAKTEAVDEAEMRARVKEKPDDIAMQFVLASWLASHKRPLDAAPIYERISTHKLATKQQRVTATASLVRIRRVDQWKKHLVAEKAALIRAAPEQAADDDILLAAMGSSIPIDERRALLKAMIAAEVDTARVNNLAYVGLAAGLTDEALVAAQRAVKEERIDQHLDTLAECFHIRGDRKAALATIDEAIGWARYNEILPTLQRNRARFESGGGDSPEVLQLRARTEDLWSRMEQVDQVAERVATPDDLEARRKVQADMTSFYRAQSELSKKVAKNCAQDANGNEEAIARVELDSQGTIKSIVLLLEPTATPTLRTCLTQQLTGQTLVADPKRTKTRLTIAFKGRE
ncbi:MAG TPA: thioredoxin family protein [Kofleriaceae bacterium]|nr:thioredoxin family protein [Kofleriaceae bacterium]